ncbi:MAG: AAA family ATPase [Clostridia bacterium]|nr:AAA family ATPase [Clostridia bacterium]
MNLNTLSSYLPAELTEALFFLGTEDLCEIRIMEDKSCAVMKGNKLTDTGIYISKAQLKKIVETMCRGSVYAAQPTLVKGFITLEGGHRVGVCAKAVCENGEVTHMTDISALCIRISREIIGAAKGIIPHIEELGRIRNTLIISPPGCGKTTVLRDIARTLGEKHKVCIADERMEIASGNVGKFTCVMSAVPKAQGISMLIRTMSPEVVITDETGSVQEEQAIYELINSGVKIITTAHGYSEHDILRRECLGKLIENGVFEKIIVLSSRKGPGTVEKIISGGRALKHA